MSKQIVSPLDMSMYRDKFGTVKMRNIFSEKALLQRWLDVEYAIAKCQAKLGMIPKKAAEEITSKASTKYVNVNRVAELYKKLGLDTAAMVRALAEVCDYEAREYVHWGATSMDIIDTAWALTLKDASEILFNDLEELEEILIKLAQEHKHTLMVARTHSQHALPITFGFKVVIWAKEIRNCIDRLMECQKRLIVGKITGAVGTQASWENMGPKLQGLVCNELGLNIPDVTIQTSRERYIEFLENIASIGNVLDKIANEIWNRQRPEVNELGEPFKLGEQVGSSTLVHKRNPFLCEWIRGLAKLVRSNASTMMGLIMEDERDGVRVPVEYAVIPESCILVSRMIESSKFILSNLIIHAENMEKNLNLTRGMLLSENVMMTLAKKGIGRQSAYDLVYDLVSKAYKGNKSLKDTLLESEKIAEYLSAEEIDRLLKPENYLGSTIKQVDATIKIIKTARG